MQYRNLGKSGLKVSQVSLGNFVTGNKPEDLERNERILKKAWEAGINFFDTAEGYANGEGEKQMGRALKKLGVPRSNYVLSTKLLFGFHPEAGDILSVNQLSCSRKHLIEGIDRSLKNLDHSYVDIVFCHRYDYDTSCEEVCFAMDQIIREGKTLYWGTSEWPVAQIVHAIGICEKNGLQKPIAEQCQYNMLVRNKVDQEYGYLFDTFGYGTTVWSPLASGVLTGKYVDTIPEGSRFANEPTLAYILQRHMGADKGEKFKAKLGKLNEIAKKLDSTLAQLAMAWVLKSKNVSTAITGCTSETQLQDTLQAILLSSKLDNATLEEIEKILENRPEAEIDFRARKPFPPRR